MKTVFISKNHSDLRNFPQFCIEHNYRLIAKSLIGFKEIPFECNESFDIVFVNSIRAFEFFIKKIPIPNDCEIACIGNITAKKLTLLGYKPTFVGENAGNPDMVAKRFKEWAGIKRVVIPSSSRSNRTVANVFDTSQVIELTVYETCLNSIFVEHADVLIFTSPSNVESFFIQNNVGDSIVIAWGNTTKKALLQQGLKDIITLEKASEKEAVKLVYERLK